MLPKRTVLLTCLASALLFTAACASVENSGMVTNDQNNNNIPFQEQSGRYITNQNGDMNETRLYPSTDGKQRQQELGFVRYNKAVNRAGDGRTVQNMYVDRPQLANYIGYLVTAYPDVDDAIVLVTDDHVFIGVNDSSGDRTLDDETVDNVRQTAMSVTPRYYKVKVADNDDFRQRISTVGDRITNSGNVDYGGEINKMLRNLGDDTPPNAVRDQRTEGLLNPQPGS